MKKEVWRVRLQDEAPRLGSGSRLVEAMVGRKWVRISDHQPPEVYKALGISSPPIGAKQKLRKSTWVNICQARFSEKLSD